MRIGDHQTAAMLDRYFTYPNGYIGNYKRSPNGFRRIGEGVYRAVFLDKAANVVYKIGDSDINELEWDNARRLMRKSTKSLGFNLRIPITTGYRVGKEIINVQEYTPGKATYCPAQYNDLSPRQAKCICKSNVCFADIHKRVQEWSGVGDMHDENILLSKDGTYWLIDLGA